ncbi:MAG: bL20 family ribosomal protein [Candidatus Dependentiae bacterium]|nr:bL20 family ribosomal protein [Candidatus Dependentiae bacterium]
MHGLATAHVQLNRKMLSQLAILDPAAFEQVLVLAKS